MLGELEDMCSKLESTASDPVFLWEDLAARCVVEDIKLFSEVYRGCTSSGGDMIVAIEAAAKTIGEKIEMENSIKFLAKQKIIEGRVIAVIPVIIILFLRICSPSYIKPMYESAGGKIIMLLALSISVTAIFLSERICKIEV
jgi:flp pilus assembly protein tadB-like protein